MLAVGLSAANTHDSAMLEPMCWSRWWTRSHRSVGEAAGPSPTRQAAWRQGVRLREVPPGAAPPGITPRIGRRGIDSSDRLGRYRWVVGRYRWVVERSQAWQVGCRRLGLRYERRADILLAFALLAAARINLRFLAK